MKRKVNANVLFEAEMEFRKPKKEFEVFKPSTDTHYPSIVIKHEINENKASVTFRIGLDNIHSFDHTEVYSLDGKSAFLYDNLVDNVADGNYSTSLVGEFCEVHFYVYETANQSYKNFIVDNSLTKEEVKEMLAELTADSSTPSSNIEEDNEDSDYSEEYEEEYEDEFEEEFEDEFEDEDED
jgi:hypothetical protein